MITEIGYSRKGFVIWNDGTHYRYFDGVYFRLFHDAWVLGKYKVENNWMILK